MRLCVFVRQTNGPLCSVRVYVASQDCEAAGFGESRQGTIFILAGREARHLRCYINTHVHISFHPETCRLIHFTVVSFINTDGIVSCSA